MVRTDDDLDDSAHAAEECRLLGREAKALCLSAFTPASVAPCRARPTDDNRRHVRQRVAKVVEARVEHELP